MPTKPLSLMWLSVLGVLTLCACGRAAPPLAGTGALAQGFVGKGWVDSARAGRERVPPGGRIYVLDRWRDRVEFPQLKRAVASQYLKWRPDEVIVEDKASGQSLIQELAQEVELGSGQGGVLIPVVAFNPGSNDKRQRASTASPYVEARRVLLPAGAPWVQEFVDECAMFPAGRHDDQVDAIVMAILRLRDRMPFTRPLDPGLVAAFADLPG